MGDGGLVQVPPLLFAKALMHRPPCKPLLILSCSFGHVPGSPGPSKPCLMFICLFICFLHFGADFLMHNWLQVELRFLLLSSPNIALPAPYAHLHFFASKPLSCSPSSNTFFHPAPLELLLLLLTGSLSRDIRALAFMG